MSKRVSLPVMSLTITGVLYIVGLLLITLRRFFVPAVVAAGPTLNTLEGFLTFLSAFLLIWAITSLVLHPDIDDDNVRLLFIGFGIILVIFLFLGSLETFQFFIGIT